MNNKHDILCEKESLYSSYNEDQIQSSEKILFDINNKWEGVVLSIENDIIYSRLFDLSSGEYDEFTFNMDLISKDDLELVDEGALFNLYTGYLVTNKTKTKSKEIKFHRKIKDRYEIDDILEIMKDIDFDNLIKRH